MSPEEMFEVFGDFDPAEHEAEASERWSAVHEVSKQRTSQYSQEQWQEAVAENEGIVTKFADLLLAGEAADALAAMDVAHEHRLSIDRWYYPCSIDQHVLLAELYLADPRFEKYWEDRGQGLTRFVHDAIKANATR